MGTPVRMRSIASPTDTDTPTDRLNPSARGGMAPAVSSYTCRLSTCTAGSADTTKYPISIPSGTSSQRRSMPARACPR